MYNLLGFNFNTQMLTIILVNTRAANIEVKIPILRVTAKPFIGPEP